MLENYKKKQDFTRLPNKNKILLQKITCTSYLFIFYISLLIKTSIFYLFKHSGGKKWTHC